MSLWDRSQNCIAQQCLTNSKHPMTHIRGVVPTHITKALGCRLFDESGKSYIDYINGLGTNLMGYGNETINRAVATAMAMGFSHSLATNYEVEAAEKLKEILFWVDRIKFVKTGSNACSTAVKIARKATGRKLVLSEGYHGESDEFLQVYNAELPSNIQALKSDLSNLNSDIAAVIVEPVITDWSDRRRSWLHQLSFECAKRGILVIYDEIITGLRWPKYTVAAWMNIRPDLICLGKTLANGLPLALVAGSKELMDRRDYFASTTYGGEVLSLAASVAVSTLLLSKKVDIERLWQFGQEWVDKFNELAKGIVQLDAYPSRGVFLGHDENVALFLQETCKAGLLFGKSWCLSFPHMQNEIVDGTFGGLKGIFQKIRDGRATLEGLMPESPLAMRVRQ